jgi:membrane protein DedA with SNARE-associated domain
MDFSALLQTFGYPLLAIGCLLEGETVLALAGFAAHQGHMDFATVALVAAVCGFIGDQTFFWLGRRHGPQMLARFPSIGAQAGRVHRMIERWHGWVIVLVRFAYGLRIAGPVLIGTSDVRPLQFAFYNAIGAAIWAPLVAGAGWFFGRAVEALLGDIHRFELGALALAALFGASWAVYRLLQRRRAPR